MLLIIIIYVMSGNASFLFVQQRVGKDELVFNLYKFRTLSLSSDSLQERRFWLGDIMRFTSLDELPQVFNVIKGDMSLIGPRPLPVAYLGRFNTFQRQRHLVLPGITGLAQVNGRNSISWDEKFSFDVFYVSNMSLVLDFKIIFKTIILILSFRKDTSLNEKEFLGNE